MCGICGIHGEHDPQRINAMVAAMHHRGPDDQGTYCAPGISLGMTRLAILDLSPTGHQPMSTPDRLIWIVYNGEVYNFQEERRILEAKGVSFGSTSDTEVLLHMYAHYGDDFLLRLRGMFALAIYDRRGGRERLFLARDHLGIKPLLYARVGGCFVFASEIKAMLAGGLVERTLNPDALRQLLTFGSVYQPNTMLKDVRMLLPAHRIIVENGRERVERYWRFGIDRRPELRHLPYEEQIEALSALLEDAVRLQMVSDVPLGAFLSGGIDSSMLVAMMVRSVGERVKTFSVGFEAEGERIDESDDARRTARFLGTDHHAVLVRGEEVRDRILHIAAGLDQPSVDGVNSYFVSMAARQGVTVALSGTGGDEIFAGYPWFIDMARANTTAKRWHVLARYVLATAARVPVAGRMIPQRYRVYPNHTRPEFVTRYGRLYQIFGEEGAARLLAKDAFPSRQDLKPIDELPRGSPIERVSALCLRGYTNNQLLRDIDAVSMAHSLEVRVPYLDPVVVDFAFSLPDHTKLHVAQGVSTPPSLTTYRDSGAKRILIDAGVGVLPDGFDRHPKRGFSMPFGAWLRGPLRDVLDDTLSDATIRARGLLDVRVVAGVRDRFLAEQLSWAQPWLLMILELWCREVLNQAVLQVD